MKNTKQNAIIAAFLVVVVFVAFYFGAVAVVDRFGYSTDKEGNSDYSFYDDETGKTDYFNYSDEVTVDGFDGFEGERLFYISSVGQYAPRNNRGYLVLPDKINGKTICLLTNCFGSSYFRRSYFGIEVSDSNEYYIYENDTLFNKDKTKLIYYYGKDTSIVVPDGVKKICDHAFYQLALESITLPDGLETIDDNAFYQCGLTALDMPDTVTFIGRFALAENPLSDFHISQGILEIDNNAFESDAFEELELPYGIEKLGSYVFGGCKLKKINLPETLTACGNEIFQGCNDLEELNIDCSFDVFDSEEFGEFDMFRHSINESYPYKYSGTLTINTKEPMYPCRFPATMRCFDEIIINEPCSSDSFEALKYYDTFEKRGWQNVNVEMKNGSNPTVLEFSSKEGSTRVTKVTLNFKE